MAINGITTAQEARVVSAELTRLTTNMGMYLLILSLSGTDVELARRVLGGLSQYADLLLEVSSGVHSDAEVSLPQELVARADKTVTDAFGGFLK